MAFSEAFKERRRDQRHNGREKLRLSGVLDGDLVLVQCRRFGQPGAVQGLLQMICKATDSGPKVVQIKVDEETIPIENLDDVRILELRKNPGHQ